MLRLLTHKKKNTDVFFKQIPMQIIIMLSLNYVENVVHELHLIKTIIFQKFKIQ